MFAYGSSPPDSRMLTSCDRKAGASLGSLGTRRLEFHNVARRSLPAAFDRRLAAREDLMSPDRRPPTVAVSETFRSNSCEHKRIGLSDMSLYRSAAEECPCLAGRERSGSGCVTSRAERRPRVKREDRGEAEPVTSAGETGVLPDFSREPRSRRRPRRARSCRGIRRAGEPSPRKPVYAPTISLIFSTPAAPLLNR